MWKLAAFMILLSGTGLLCAGCSTKLETGYEPTRLGMSLAERRALYTDPYTRQAQEAQQDRAQTMQDRRPTN